MKYIIGKNRQQTSIFPVSLEESLAKENEVRLIDLFVESLNLKEYGFKLEFGENGRPAYHPADLLKLYIYGYMNRIRSSRQLEKECTRNIEVMWLLKSLKPDHNTISNFRRDNSKINFNELKINLKLYPKNFVLSLKRFIFIQNLKLYEGF